MLLNFFNTIQAIDKGLLYFVHHKLSANWLNKIMPFLREPLFWSPLYLLVLIVAAKYYKNKFFYWVLFLIGTVSISDSISSKLLKNTVKRIRPCNDASIAQNLHVLVKYKPQSFSFTSSHAFNYFTVTFFALVTLWPILKKYRYAFYIWPALIGYAQIYVGVHYPLDVLCGSILGAITGYFCGKAFLNVVLGKQTITAN
jgi:membrane-associated phospholipid phosphatase